MIENRQNRPIRVIQFGAGNFLRAFADWMIEVLNEQTAFDGGVVVVKATPGSYDELQAQAGRFHVLTEGVVQGEVVRDLQAVRCIERVVASDAFDDFLALAEIETARIIISNTTEAGIVYDPADNFADTPPRSFPAKLTRLLYRRWQSNSAENGFIILPTELIAANGSQLRDCVLRYAGQWQLSAEFTDWIKSHNTFCNTLVDRIVTGHPADSDSDDPLLVAAEPYHLWAIEAPSFVADELPFDQTNLNVKFVADLMATRKLKVRILNGAHTSMVPLGLLAGFTTVREAVEDVNFGRFLTRLLYDEIVPTLDDATATEYVATTLDRFRNPAIAHQLSAIALNSSSKFRVRVLPSLLYYLERNDAVPPRLTLAFAALLRFYKGTWRGQSLPVKDDPAVVTFFETAWENSADASEVVKHILQNEALWGEDLSRYQTLVSNLVTAIDQIETDIVASYGADNR